MSQHWIMNIVKGFALKILLMYGTDKRATEIDYQLK